ncbi:MAG: helix-turn-helix transcriptional regulator [Ruminococcaceae bacterium]|nr:helix-turn-helix transcriptional regulator [Oscillospiraceae bacterium]
MTIGESIRKVREERGYSRQRLARKLGLHLMTIVQWERDVSYPRMKPLIALADALNVSLDELVGRRM